MAIDVNNIKVSFEVWVSGDELKSCPKCASGRIGYGISQWLKNPMFFVLCDHCGINTRNHETKEAAFKDWNTRFSDK